MHCVWGASHSDYQVRSLWGFHISRKLYIFRGAFRGFFVLYCAVLSCIALHWITGPSQRLLRGILPLQDWHFPGKFTWFEPRMTLRGRYLPMAVLLHPPCSFKKKSGLYLIVCIISYRQVISFGSPRKEGSVGRITSVGGGGMVASAFDDAGRCWATLSDAGRYWVVLGDGGFFFGILWRIRPTFRINEEPFPANMSCTPILPIFEPIFDNFNLAKYWAYLGQ